MAPTGATYYDTTTGHVRAVSSFGLSIAYDMSTLTSAGTIEDFSGNHDGTLFGSPGFVSAEFGPGLRLDPADVQYVNTAHTSTLDRTNASVSMSMWLTFHETGRTQSIAGKIHAFEFSYGIQTLATDQVRVSWRNPAGSFFQDTGFFIVGNVSYHLGFVIADNGTGINGRFFANGTLQTTWARADSEAIGDTGEDFRIARTANGAVNTWGNITMDELIVVNRNLTTDEFAGLGQAFPTTVTLVTPTEVVPEDPLRTQMPLLVGTSVLLAIGFVFFMGLIGAFQTMRGKK